MLKQLMIPVAAFAITVTGASAFTGDWIQNLDLNLSDEQTAALEEAHEIRQAAAEEARQVLEDAGIDGETMREIHGTMHEAGKAQHEAMRTAIENNDYDAFLAAIADTPLADSIDSEADFEKFVEAHELMQSGDFEAAAELMSELGLEGPGGGLGLHIKHRFGGPGPWSHSGDRQSAEAE